MTYDDDHMNGLKWALNYVCTYTCTHAHMLDWVATKKAPITHVHMPCVWLYKTIIA